MANHEQPQDTSGAQANEAAAAEWQVNEQDLPVTGGEVAAAPVSEVTPGSTGASVSEASDHNYSYPVAQSTGQPSMGRLGGTRASRPRFGRLG